MDRQSHVPIEPNEPGQKIDRVAFGQQVARSLDEATPAFLELWRIVAARKWLVLAITIGAIVVGLLTVRQLTPIYRATATVLIEQGSSKVVSIEEVYSGASANREYLVTQAEFLKSRNVAMRVIGKMDLANHPEFAPPSAPPAFVAFAKSWLKFLLIGEHEARGGASGNVDDEVVRAFEKRLDIQPVRMSQLVSVSFESADRMLAAAVANAVAEAYVDADMDARYAMVQRANAWLAERVETLRTNLAASEQVLQAYRDRKGILDKQSAAQGGAARQLEGTTQRLIEARVRRTQAEQAYNQARSLGASALEIGSAVQGNPAVARADQARELARRELADISRRLGPAHPSYQAAESALAAAQRSHDQAVTAAVFALRKEYEAARAVERELEQALSATQGEIRGQNRDEFELTHYEREVATNRQLYDTFLARLKETAATTGLQNPVARIMDPAVPPSVASRPSRSLLLLIAGLAGLMAGIVSAMLLHRLDRTIRTVESAESRLQYPVVAALPRLDPADQASAHRLVLSKPGSAFSEAIRTARTSIMLSSADEGCKVILVASSNAGEGKSTFAMNLAFAQAQTKRTLLIEADMRRPTHAKLLGLDTNEPGLSEVIAGTVSMRRCIQKAPDGELDVLNCGAIPPNPLELISSKRFKLALSRLRAAYEMIVIDSPPVSLVSDAVVAATQATNVLFVVRAGSTPHQAARQALRKLAVSGAPVLGLILNDFDFKGAQKYYGETHGYSAAGYGGYSRTAERIE